MSEGTIRLADADATAAIGAAIGLQLVTGDVVALAGPLGAGKTTLARGILSALGLAGEVASPSFALVIDYRPPEVRLPVAHADLYRVQDRRELDELGLDEALDAGALLVEWPDRAGLDAWPHALRLSLADGPGAGRCLTWTAPAAWEARWPPARP